MHACYIYKRWCCWTSSSAAAIALVVCNACLSQISIMWSATRDIDNLFVRRATWGVPSMQLDGAWVSLEWGRSIMFERCLLLAALIQNSSPIFPIIPCTITPAYMHHHHHRPIPLFSFPPFSSEQQPKELHKKSESSWPSSAKTTFKEFLCSNTIRNHNF